VRPDVAPVAREGLVAHVARQRDLDVLAGHLAQVARRHGRRVGERLAVVAHDAGQQAHHVRLDDQLVVVGSPTIGHEARERQLVVLAPALREADRERLHAAPRLARHARHDD
jgi:hypothetical protein